jgi:hypothetical protein
MNRDREREISFEEAVMSWCAGIYLPIVAIIREERILPRFAGRTESDLYIWIARHWEELKSHYGEHVPMRDAARDFSHKHGRGFLTTVFDVVKLAVAKILRG